jgi:transposase
MECFGLPEAVHNGENCRPAMGRGSRYIHDSLNGGIAAFWRKFSVLFLLMPIGRISALILLASKCIKAQTVGKKTADKAVGRTKGGLNTKIHTVVDGLGNPLYFLLSAGNVNDSEVAVDVLSHVDISQSNVLADKAYGTNDILDYIQRQDSEYTIPPKANTVNPWRCDWVLYKERHLIECFFQQIKWFRRIATRYDKLDASFLAFVYLAAIMVLLK